MRSLRQAEIAGLLADDTIAHLATLDPAGYPHVTPIWFLWDGAAFRLTSHATRPHVRRIRENPRVGLVIDRELGLRADGQRPNRQLRVIGDAALADDDAGLWTARIHEKYLRDRFEHRTRDGRALITITPALTWAVASV
ncbi:pyridoxamine 5'-phosphate oxidase family protein [Nocardia sp. NPDC048505]|uniref:pyridoxamine 5'-phosphate oxidase family protein n=1 Tax=unclassified Nocardia TaxID=2637762 RepID=UPI0033DE5B22